MNIIINWILSAIAIGISAYLLPGVTVTVSAALIAAVVLGLINALLRPVLILLTLPINIITLGLFTIVINGALVLLAAEIVPGFSIAGFWWAALFGIVLALVTMGLSLFGRKNTE
jgi:putative membrane protein